MCKYDLSLSDCVCVLVYDVRINCMIDLGKYV